MSITFQENGNIGFITFDQNDSKVNLLSADMLKRLDAVLDDVKKKASLKAVIFRSAKKDVFIAGADIKEIEKIVEPGDGQKKAQAG
jgi:3-hydroxyacyl-CoA dehydrogenase/enoyl-CoA hydratase/3-hydroxybutyryl-CoA epimerase